MSADLLGFHLANGQENSSTHAKKLRLGVWNVYTGMVAIGKCARITSSRYTFSEPPPVWSSDKKLPLFLLSWDLEHSCLLKNCHAIEWNYWLFDQGISRLQKAMGKCCSLKYYPFGYWRCVDLSLVRLQPWRWIQWFCALFSKLDLGLLKFLLYPFRFARGLRDHFCGVVGRKNVTNTEVYPYAWTSLRSLQIAERKEAKRKEGKSWFSWTGSGGARFLVYNMLRSCTVTERSEMPLLMPFILLDIEIKLYMPNIRGFLNWLASSGRA